MDDARAYYSENDPVCAEWLRNLIAAGLIAPGDVDERSIVDIKPSDLAGYTQVHHFAGVGIWSLALRNAGWPDHKPVWTGSCPCQPFSAAGKGGGFADERHLWPAFFHLIQQCEPASVYGEQVASKDGLAWIDLVQSDMEGTHYAFGAHDSCAAGFGAPHIRQRLYWVADAGSGRQHDEQGVDGVEEGAGQRQHQSIDGRDFGILVDREREGLEGHAGDGDRSTGWPFPYRPVAEAGSLGELADTDSLRRDQARERLATAGHDGVVGDGSNAAAGPVNGLWRDADWLRCRDDKWRPVEPGTFPLAHGAASRVGRLRAYGNAIVAAQATEFIAATMTQIESCHCGDPATPCDKTRHDYGHDCVEANL